MRRLTLTATEPAARERTCNTPSDRRLRERCQAVRMARRGRKRKAIAPDCGVHRTTVRLWRNQDRTQGVEGRQIHWAPGQPGRMSPTLVSTIPEWGKAGPTGWGLDRANWPDEELATYVYQPTGIPVKRTALRDFGQRHARRPYRPTSRSVRGDPEEQRVAQEALAA
jgi:transposase